MDKPKVGDKIRLTLDMREATDWDVVEVEEVYDPPIETWWNTAVGEAKVGLMDALREYGPEKAATATWYAIVSSTHVESGMTIHDGTMAVASFECEPYNA